MATENILMAAVAAGGDRQTLHEKIRRHSQAAAKVVKQDGLPNDLLTRLAADDAFHGIQFDDVMNPSRFVGPAPEQVDEFIREVIDPMRRKHPAACGLSGEVQV